MKLGCAVGCFTYPSYEAPYEEAIQKIGSLGFQGLELIAYKEEDLKEYYTTSTIHRLKDLYQGYGMELSEFIVYASLVEGLVSRDLKEKQRAFDTVKRCMEVAWELGTDKINLVSGWPKELKAPIAYPPSYIHPFVSGVQKFEPKLKMELPPNFDANGVWDNYVESLAKVTEMAGNAGMYVVLEGHANVIVGNTDAMMRAFDRISSPHLGTNFDTAWHFMQREYLPWSIYKLRERILHVHLRDGDGRSVYSLPPGLGAIDWRGVIRALKEVGYDGYLSFELSKYDRPETYLKESKQYLENIMREEGII